MNIIIAGAGRVGHLLAKTLSRKHNVTIIDKDGQILHVLGESVDLLSITGDIEDPDTYASLLNKSFDIFIAVTDNDEANLLSTLIADDVIDAKRKIIRLKNAYFAKSTIAEKLGISDAVFPFAETALALKTLLEFPQANNVKEFKFTDFKLISVFVQESEVAGERVGIFESEYVTVAGIERDKKFLIPGADEIIREHDLIYFFGNAGVIRQECEKIDTKMPTTIKNIAIFGAGPLGLEIAKVLSEEKNREIKLIEKDNTRCMEAAEILQDRVQVINSRYIEHAIYEDEQIAQADMVISTHTQDEQNIIQSLEAQEYGVPKTVAINNNREYYELMHKLGIVAARGPKVHAYYAIVEKIGSSSIIFERHYCGGNATVYVRKIFPDSALIGKQIKPFKGETVKSVLVRDGVIHPFTESFELLEGDLIFLFMASVYEEKVKQWIYSL